MSFVRRSYTDYTPDALTKIIYEGLPDNIPRSMFRVHMSDVAPGSIGVRFLGDGSIVLDVPQTYASTDRRDHFTNAWMVLPPLFANARISCPPLVGESACWVDDVPLTPGMAFSGNGLSAVLLPDQQYLESDGYATLREVCETHFVPWHARTSRILWRGSSTGIRQYLRVTALEDLPRIKLAIRAKAIDRPDALDVGISQIVQIWNQDEIDKIHALNIIKPEIQLLDFMNNKGAIDVDGNSNSWSGLFTKFIMGNLVFKVDSEMGYRQWYYDRLVPWKNFIPISYSLKELNGVVDWFLNNDGEVRAIADRGRELAKSLNLTAVILETTDRLIDYLSRGKYSAS